MSDPVLDHARAAIAHGSRSFAMAARLLSPQVRDDATLLYAWCRHCDDVIDGQVLGHGATPVANVHARLERLRNETEAALNGEPGSAPFMALARVAKRRTIPRAHFDALLDGFAMDVNHRRYDRIEETLEYCYHAAGVVGVMMAMVMGVRDARALTHAADLGIAFQLTNIARDVVEDVHLGRCYLPTDLLRAEGLTQGDLVDPAAHPRAHRVACRLIDLAEDYYASGYRGLAMLPSGSVWGIAAARRVYRDIGAKSRKVGPDLWARRITTSPARKVLLLALAAGDGPRARFAARLRARQSPERSLSRSD